MLQAGKSRVRFPIKSLNFFILPNVDLYILFPIRLHGVVLNLLSTGTTLSLLLPDLSSRSVAVGLTQSPTEMSTRNFPGG
jgi:hypothetical protein